MEEEIDDLQIIAEGITENNYELIAAINDIHKKFIDKIVKVSITQFIRWCRSAAFLNNLNMKDFTP